MAGLRPPAAQSQSQPVEGEGEGELFPAPGRICAPSPPPNPAVTAAHPGTRHTTLLTAALGRRLVAAGELRDDDARTALHAAAAAHIGVEGMTAQEVTSTIDDGLRHGRQRPAACTPENSPGRDGVAAANERRPHPHGPAVRPWVRAPGAAAVPARRSPMSATAPCRPQPHVGRSPWSSQCSTNPMDGFGRNSPAGRSVVTGSGPTRPATCDAGK